MKKLFGKLKNPVILKRIILAAVIVLITASMLYYQSRKGRVFIDDSLVTAPIVSVAPATGEELTELDVYEGEHVTKGDALGIVGGQTLYADTDGLVIMANNQIGSMVSVQDPLAQIIHTPDMRITGTIDENKGLIDIKIGQVASFTVDALPGQTFWGYVDEVSPSAKQTALAFSISSERPTQQFVVYVKYDTNKYPQIKNGMSAKLTVYTDIQ